MGDGMVNKRRLANKKALQMMSVEYNVFKVSESNAKLLSAYEELLKVSKLGFVKLFQVLSGENDTV